MNPMKPQSARRDRRIDGAGHEKPASATRRSRPLTGRGDKPFVMSHRPALAGERVMHVGEPVALVVAETLLAALDAAEKVAVEYEEPTP